MPEKGELCDYKIARKLWVDTGTVTRSTKAVLLQIEPSQADLDFAFQVSMKIKV